MIFIVAEIGINHNGDINIAKDLIKVAKESGCNAVKFQKRTIEIVYDQKFLDESRISPFGVTQRAQKMGLEFNENDYNQIDRYCKEIGIDWFASCWDIPSFHFLKKYKLSFNKIASPMISKVSFLSEVAQEGKHTFISTGMSDERLISQAVGIFKEHHCPFTLMHCVSIYPPAPEDMNMRKIQTLFDEYECPVGFSDHSLSSLFSVMAGAMGVSAIERHITLDKLMYGSDQKISLDPIQLKHFVMQIRQVEQSLGSGELFIDEGEVANMLKLRPLELR